MQDFLLRIHDWFNDLFLVCLACVTLGLFLGVITRMPRLSMLVAAIATLMAHFSGSGN